MSSVSSVESVYDVRRCTLRTYRGVKGIVYMISGMLPNVPRSVTEVGDGFKRVEWRKPKGVAREKRTM